MNSEPDLSSTLQQIIKQEYNHHIKDWSFAAKPNEKKGLYLISKIMKYGEKWVCDSNKPIEKETIQDLISYKAALINYGKLSSSSTYKNHYTSSKDFVYKNVFNNKELKEMTYSKILTSQAADYISNWIKNEQSEEYKNHVLEFLRAFNSTVNQNTNRYETVQRRDFISYNKNDLFTNLSFFSNGSHQKDKLLNVSIDEMRKNLKIDELKEKYDLKYGAKSPINVGAYNYESQELINQKKQELIRGNKNLIKGICGGTTNTSTYLELYKGYNNRSSRIKVPVESINLRYVSGIKGKIPDPFMMGVQKEKLTIDDTTKQNVTRIVGGFSS